MPTRDEVWERKKEASGQVSTQTRTLALGFVALAWALLTAHDDPLKSMVAHVNRYWILIFAAISVFVLVLDMCQYVAITRMADSAFRKAEAAGIKDDVKYDSESCAYKAQAFFYRAKLWALVLAAVLLFIIFMLLLLPIHPK